MGSAASARRTGSSPATSFRPPSSRRHLYSYVMNQNLPRGYPQLRPQMRWVFFFKGDLRTEPLEEQGFEPVHRGDALRIYRRG